MVVSAEFTLETLKVQAKTQQSIFIRQPLFSNSWQSTSESRFWVHQHSMFKYYEIRGLQL